jgi:large subunit ribosomal protein L3
MTHGSMIHRKPQSGGATDAAARSKGVKRPGRMGGRTVTQRGLTVTALTPSGT